MKIINPRKIFYIGVPFCIKRCYYCNFSFFTGKQDGYIELLKKEFGLRFNGPLEVEAILIGGGTPNYLSLSELEELLIFINEKLIGYKEFTIEVHPSFLTNEQIDLFVKYGVNRISIGIQSTSDNVLKMNNRLSHNYKNIPNYLKSIRKYDNLIVNFDFMYGLLGDSFNTIKNDLKYISIYKPDQICYEKIRIITDNYRKINNIKLFTKRTFFLYFYIKKFLISIGYIQKEGGFFCLPNKMENVYQNIHWGYNSSVLSIGTGSRTHLFNTVYHNEENYFKYKEYILDGKIAQKKNIQKHKDYLRKKFSSFIHQRQVCTSKDFENEYGLGTFEQVKDMALKLKKRGFIYIEENNGIFTFILKEKGKFMSLTFIYNQKPTNSLIY